MSHRFYIILILIVGCSVFTSPVQAQPRLQLDHVALCVKDLDSSIAFYSRYFRLDSIPNPFAKLNVKFKVKWFKLEEGLQMHMVAGLQDTLSLPMFAHLSFRVPSPDNFAEQLKKDGIPFYGGPGMLNQPNHRADGVTQLLFKDPNGYWIEVNNAPKRKP